jgi:hypothetical protein
MPTRTGRLLAAVTRQSLGPVINRAAASLLAKGPMITLRMGYQPLPWP